jgi:hypothetical protein
MVRKPGQPARFGVETKLEVAPPLVDVNVQTYLEGGISWYHEPKTSEDSGVPTGDYHEYFEIHDVSTKPELIESRLIFWGVPHEHNPAAPDNAFLTLPSTCATQPITYLHVSSYEDPTRFLKYENATPVRASGCDSLTYQPQLSLAPATTQQDQPDGPTLDMHVPQFTDQPQRPGSPDLQTAQVTLPEGMTLNASAANGLQACTDDQIGLGTDTPIACPAASRIGSVVVDAPGIPADSLVGSVYLAAPQAGQSAQSGGKYRIFIAAEAPLYGVGVRLEGRVSADERSGRLTATVSDNPQVPFEDLTLGFNTGPRAPLANPLGCGPAQPSAALLPFTGQPAQAALSSGFNVDANGAGAPCPPPPFSLVQSAPAPSPALAGASSPFTFTLARADGQQYLAAVSTTLPPGLVGLIPSVPLCPSAQAADGSCPAASQIGTVRALAGAGSEPYAFSGRAYLTGPYGGGPYGLSLVVPAIAGPYDLGTVVARAAINVGLYSGRATVTGALPTIVQGVPVRLRSLSVSVNRPGFLLNPTSCSPLQTESVLTSTFGAAQNLASPFQVTACDRLAFKPKLTAHSRAKTSKANGASLEARIVQSAHQANIRQLQVQLPKRLVARLTTLQKACPAATFQVAAPPGACPPAARVGAVTVRTPVLPGTLSGPVYLISHGGAAFPDLDLVVRGDGVEVVLVGHTRISRKDVISTTFASLPDVPISSVAVRLPVGPHSILAANGSLCAHPLRAPVKLLAQSGATLKRNIAVTVTGCPLAIIAHRTSGRHATVAVRVPGAGRIRLRGRGLRRVTRHPRQAEFLHVHLALTHRALRTLHRSGRLTVRLRVLFKPASGRRASSKAAKLVFGRHARHRHARRVHARSRARR